MLSDGEIIVAPGGPFTFAVNRNPYPVDIICIVEHGKTKWRLFVNEDGKVDFEGDMTEAARALCASVRESFNWSNDRG